MEKYTARELARKLGVSRTVVERIINNNEIGTVLIGKRRYVTKKQLDEYVGNAVVVEETVSADDMEFDSEGVKWNAAIHSSTRKQNNDGTWRKRHGANTRVSLVDKVNAELVLMGDTEVTERERRLVVALERALNR